jgi:hypothetical protein
MSKLFWQSLLAVPAALGAAVAVLWFRDRS